MCGPHGKTQLAVIWVRDDRAAAETLVFQYVSQVKANGWWRGVSLLIMGPAAALLAGDKDLQEKTRALQSSGVEVKTQPAGEQASKLRELGFDVVDLAEGLTAILKDEDEDWATLTV